LGGLNTGFLKPLYQVLMELIVKSDPTIPANWQRIINIINVDQDKL